jgi:outer membrane protein
MKHFLNVSWSIKKTNMKQMKKIVTIALVVASLVMVSHTTKAQGKIAFVSMQELVAAMPESKKADTALNDYQSALAQNFDDMKREYYEQDSLLNSKDTVKYTKAQLELKKKNMSDMLIKLQGWQQQAQQMYQQKYQELLSPIQKKAVATVEVVAKENGYTFVFTKEALLVSPPAEDLLPLVKKKLGLK